MKFLALNYQRMSLRWLVGQNIKIYSFKSVFRNCINHEQHWKFPTNWYLIRRLKCILVRALFIEKFENYVLLSVFGQKLPVWTLKCLMPKIHHMFFKNAKLEKVFVYICRYDLYTNMYFFFFSIFQSGTKW